MASAETYNGVSGTPLLAADGTPRLPHIAYDEDGYPHTDGEPLGQNAAQIKQIVYAFPALEALLRRRFPGALVGCDMFIYSKRGVVAGSVAPDVFVAFGAGDHLRDSYKLFEGEPVPAFVLEVLSESTGARDLDQKYRAYRAMGVGEYWLFDPFAKRIPERIRAYRLSAKRYVPMAPLPDSRSYLSGALGLELRAEGEDLRIRDPATGEDLMGYEEEQTARQAAEARADSEAAARREEAAARHAAEDRAEREAAARRAAEAELERLRRSMNDRD